ncbi:cytochrome c-type biogenesis protein CcmE [Anoxybacillus tengchongensis]|uniref:Cytochrome c-type biogenesis protein CcmE n=1 Tax=Anoxybacillus tengchongensis TaxID=576944 RepID=A0A7W9YNE5_9BACL|nr:cytochrome c maturation protein CcmE [Anoxybacillus tengchongensis]MBB6175403.1 cytochrome c-type biogenesis protein CcmE [Anoxybacillus tengchongensis]
MGNKKIIVGICFIVLAIGMLLFTSMPSASVVEVKLKDLTKNEQYKNEYVLTQGMLKQSSVRWDAKRTQLSFELYDQSETIQVRYTGAKPDNFSDGVIVIIEGKWRNDIFYAEKVQTKCPSKYEGEDMKKYDKEMHKKLLD